MKRFFLLLLVFVTSVTLGQKALHPEGEAQLSYLKTQYPDWPKQRMDSVTMALDSTAIAAQCYRYITNADKTKFIAFYLTEKFSDSFNAIKREYGGTYHSYLWNTKKDNQLEIFAYTIAGMYYQGRWYYDLDEYVEFYAPNPEEAKDQFLLQTLTDLKFFSGKSTKENKSFWNKNQFEKNTYAYKEDYPNTPEVVAAALLVRKAHDTHNQNKKVEKKAGQVAAIIWESLQKIDSTHYHHRYKGKYMKDFNLQLYNKDRSLVLLPMIYYDDKDHAFLTYYVLKLSDATASLYRWNAYPEKPINRDRGEESMEVIYDIRKHIQNWGWGTQNMISTVSFWNENFKETQLEPCNIPIQ